MDIRFKLAGLCRKFSYAVAGLVMASSAMAAQQDSSLNQLFRMDTPSKSAQGEGFVTGQISWLSLESADIIDVRGIAEYGITPELSARLTVPWRKASPDKGDDESEIIDIRIGAQYKLSQYIDPKIVQATAQLVIGLPTADDDKGLDKGKFELEPSLLLYKNFGEMGPGVLGGYGQIGANFASGAHNIILAGAATYTIYNDWTLVSELYLACGGLTTLASASDLEWIPGVVYRGVKGFEFAVGIPIGITSDAPDWGLIGKVTWAW